MAVGILNNIESVSRSALAITATLLLGVVGLQVEWRKVGLATDSFCFERAAQLYKAELAGQESVPEHLVEIYSERCGTSLDEARRTLSREKILQEFKSAAKTHQNGFVALKKSNVESLDDVNFSFFDDETATLADMSPEVGSKLQTKWPVNLRGNTSDVSEGNNPILRILEQGQCVVTEGSVEGHRTLLWVPVRLEEC